MSEQAAVNAMRYLPATLEASRPKEGAPRIAKVRIYADPAVRALPNWKSDITDEIDYASQLLQPLLGVRLAIESIHDWPRSGDPSGALRELAALAEPDPAEPGSRAQGDGDSSASEAPRKLARPGDQVTWVIGYIAPPDKASRVMAELGDAQPLGRHVVVRGWAEKTEVELLAGQLPDVRSSDRADLVNAHHRHKQTVVLLHMLAATLGAIAEVDSTWIQHTSYSPKQHTFANRTRELLQLAIDARLAGETDESIARKLTDSIEKSEWGGWIPASHKEVVAALRTVVDAGRAGKTFAEIPPAAYDQFKRISELAKHGKTSEALTELDNLLVAYPGNATMHQLKCEIMLDKPGLGDPATRAVCDRVSELAPGDPTVHIAVAEAQIQTRDVAAARAELLRAEDKIANLPTGRTEAWRRVIGIYTALGALTWTEDAIARAKLDGDPAAVAAAQVRARYGIPRGARFVVPDQEAALVGAIRGALDLVYANKFGDAERVLAAAEKKWPGAPGLFATRCDLAFRTGQLAAARAACARALAGDPRDSWALYLMGVLLLRDRGTTAAGIDRLKAAIEVDPDLGQAWRTLGKAYARTGKKAELDRLAAAYAAKFGQPLPP